MPRNPVAMVARLSDQQQSMISSHLAGRGAFCCSKHAAARSTVTRSKSLQDWLAEHAYEEWGCHPNDLVESSRSGRYLEKFLALV